MVLVLNIILVIINSIQAIVKKKENKIILFVSFIILLFIMTGFRGGFLPTDLSHDMYNYNKSYLMIQNGTISSFVEPGYKLLVIICSRILKMDFLLFYFAIQTIALFIINHICKIHMINRHVVFSLFASFLHIYSCVQFQNYIAVIIATIAFIHLIFDNKEGINYRFIAGITIASLFHYTMLIFLVFSLVNVKNKKMLIKTIVSAIILLCFIEWNTGTRLNLNIILSKISYINQNASRYYTISRYGWLYGVLFQISLILISLFNKKQIAYLQVNNIDTPVFLRKATDCIFWINILGIAFFPLYMINTQLVRLGRSCLLINYMICGLIINYLSPRKRLYCVLIYILWTIIYGYIYIVLMNETIDSVFWPFFNKNAYF